MENNSQYAGCVDTIQQCQLSQPGFWKSPCKGVLGNRGTLEVRLDRIDGPMIARVDIGRTEGWNVVTSPLMAFQPGIHNVIVLLRNNGNVELDWIRLE